MPSVLQTWTTDRIEALKIHFAAGLSCREIANEIGVSRNAVIGKIHRLGLSTGRPVGAPAQSCPPRAGRPRAPSQRRLLRLVSLQTPDGGAPITLGAPVESVHPCALTELAERTCRWPLGDPMSDNFAYCGNDAINGFTYCVGHARMAYRSANRRSA